MAMRWVGGRRSGGRGKHLKTVAVGRAAGGMVLVRCTWREREKTSKDGYYMRICLAVGPSHTVGAPSQHTRTTTARCVCVPRQHDAYHDSTMRTTTAHTSRVGGLVGEGRPVCFGEGEEPLVWYCPIRVTRRWVGAWRVRGLERVAQDGEGE